MTITIYDAERLSRVATYLAEGAGAVQLAINCCPVSGGAELHCLRLDLQAVHRKLIRCAETAEGIAQE